MNRKWNIMALVLALLLLTGCSLRTLDDLYQVPKRSDDYSDLQSAIDKNMSGREYCAPLNGENLQTVQMADLDGDGVQEYLLFAKGTEEKPLQILIFRLEAGEYVLSDTIESHGTAFDLVEYARMDDRPGYELIVGCQISQDVARSVSVYCLREGKAVSLMSANYTKFLSCDLTGDDRSELMVLRPGESDEDNGLAELYHYSEDIMTRSGQISLSESTERLKRIELGVLQDGKPAVYVDMSVGVSSVTTDIFTVLDGQFTNLNTTADRTLRGDYIYAEDIDGDGVLEIPQIAKMILPAGYQSPSMHHLLRWNSLSSDGEMVDKRHTYHNLHGGWYLVLDSTLSHRMAVVRLGNLYEFFVWNEDFTSYQKIMTVYILSGSDRRELAVKDGRFAICEDDTTLYAAMLWDGAGEYGISQQQIIERFHLIHQDWKTQEVTK